ncbi:LysR family transcriptional regulator [Microbispora sp. ATCC PTA-5024]|uniref:LysR family transcriptional regulator n=1 Tax=Microbispora sp. ATCC PTA-5024 TaxID=316330 RepID=UPI0003DC1CB1|nr:LysR family transcriptional regulator [Microbispora sp. ATCC PTA-5024]ETK32686.1 LysR family transcriptional regulator [Microbispora sp. ATCC PTA-5024]
MFETDALVLLDIVARTGSFTAAALQLSYTQSAVSRRIASLEAEAGGPLFERLPRGVRLTPAGRALHRHAREVLERLRRAGEELSAIHTGTGGRLRVGAFATANAVLVPAALRAFREESPEVGVTLVEGLSGALMEALGRGEIDIAVVSDYPSGLGPGEDAEVVPLMEDELLVALPADHPLAAWEEVDLRDLKDESWIEGAPPGSATMLAAACARAGFTPRVDIRIAEWTGKLGYVAAGLGVTLVPAMAAPAVRSDIALRRLGDLAPRRSVYAALPRTTALPAARTLLALLRDRVPA